MTDDPTYAILRTGLAWLGTVDMPEGAILQHTMGPVSPITPGGLRFSFTASGPDGCTAVIAVEVAHPRYVKAPGQGLENPLPEGTMATLATMLTHELGADVHSTWNGDGFINGGIGLTALLSPSLAAARARYRQGCTEPGCTRRVFCGHEAWVSGLALANEACRIDWPVPELAEPDPEGDVSDPPPPEDLKATVAAAMSAFVELVAIGPCPEHIVTRMADLMGAGIEMYHRPHTCDAPSDGNCSICRGIAARIAPTVASVIYPWSVKHARDAAAAQPTPVCTGLAARWCEIHGDCTCPEDAALNSHGCPLHGANTKHGDPELTGDAAAMTSAVERWTKLDRACAAIEAGVDPVDALADLEEDDSASDVAAVPTSTRTEYGVIRDHNGSFFACASKASAIAAQPVLKGRAACREILTMPAVPLTD